MKVPTKYILWDVKTGSCLAIYTDYAAFKKMRLKRDPKQVLTTFTIEHLEE